MKQFSLISFFALFLAGCFGGSDSGNSKELVIVNVMDEKYYQDCHIKGSIHIPFDKFDDRIKSMNKNNEYVLYCSNYACTTSDFCVKIMKKAGFKNVFKYPGGIVEWYAKGYPVTGPCKMDYLKEENEKFDDEDADYIVSAEDLKSKMDK